MTKKKGNRPYAPGNATPDGDYVVGKGKPPESGKFRTGDGRQRGRRRKGTKNLATDLRAELDALVSVTVGGKTKKVTRQRAIMMRLGDNATKGQNVAIALAVDLQQRVVEPILIKEQGAYVDEEKYDYTLLSRDEMLALECLLTKALGEEPYAYGPEIIIKPYDWAQSYRDERKNEDG